MPYAGASLVVQMIKNMPAMQETQVCSLGLENSLDIHSSIVVWRIPWTEEPGGLHFMAIFTLIYLQYMPWWVLVSQLSLILCNPMIKKKKKKISPQTKAQVQMASQGNSIKHLEKSYCLCSWNSSKKGHFLRQRIFLSQGSNFVQDFCIYVHQWPWPIILFYLFFLHCLCLVLVSGWWWSCRMGLQVFLCLKATRAFL